MDLEHALADSLITTKIDAAIIGAEKIPFALDLAVSSIVLRNRSTTAWLASAI